MDERVTNCRNRVFEQNLTIGKDIPHALTTDSNFNYRVTGMNQIADIIVTGYVRPNEGKIKGGHHNEVFWTHGSDKLFYYDKRPVLEVPVSKLQNNQTGAISINDLSAIYIFYNEENKYINRLEFFLDEYLEYQEKKTNIKR